MAGRPLVLPAEYAAGSTRPPHCLQHFHRQCGDTRLPWLVAVVVAASMLLLLVVFRSVAVAIKAAVMNLLSISAAAAIMVVVFLSFVLGADVSVKQVGLGLAAAVLIDATIVRLVLVPAVMGLLGKANWWLPAPLARLAPKASRREDEPPAVARVPVGAAD